MRKVIRWAFVSVTVLIAIGISAIWMLYQASRQEPKFYQAALRMEPTRQVEAGDQFEHEVLELHNEARKSGEWAADFTAEQINAWLAGDLPEKFPAALPKGVQDPRVAFEDGIIQVAARFQSDSMSTVLSFALDVQLADEANVIAIRVRDVRAGALPVPMSAWLEKVQDRFRQTELNIHWSQADGDPVAVIEVPLHNPNDRKQSYLLDSIAIDSGVLRLAGRTGSAESLGLEPPTTSAAIVQRVPWGGSPEKKTTHR